MHILHFITPINYSVYLDWLLPQYLIFLFTFLAEKAAPLHLRHMMLCILILFTYLIILHFAGY